MCFSMRQYNGIQNTYTQQPVIFLVSKLLKILEIVLDTVQLENNAYMLIND